MKKQDGDHAQGATTSTKAIQLVENLMQATVDYERAEGFEAKYLRQDLNEARAAIEAALSVAPAEGGMLTEQERHAIEHARHQFDGASIAEPDCTFDFELVGTLLKLLDRRFPAEMVAQCPDCPSPYLNGACGGNECCQGGPYTEGASVVRHELEAGGFYKTRGDKHNLPHIVGPLDHDPDDRDAPWKARVHDQVWKWGYDGLANAEGSHNRDIVERVYPPSSRSQPGTERLYTQAECVEALKQATAALPSTMCQPTEGER